MLLEVSGRHALRAWKPWGQCFNAMVLLKRGDAGVALDSLSPLLDELSQTRLFRSTVLMVHWAEARWRTGQVGQGLIEVDRELENCERNDERWCIPELLRIKGELVLLRGAPDASAKAQACLREGMEQAARQGALSLELRAGMSLARLLLGEDQSGRACKLLTSLYGRYTEGFATDDLTSARTLLDELDAPAVSAALS